MTETNQVSKPNKIRPSEIMFLLGMLLLFAGLWIWFGIGPASAAVGIVLIAVAILNDWMGWRSNVI
jgi:hypothetical protein